MRERLALILSWVLLTHKRAGWCVESPRLIENYLKPKSDYFSQSRVGRCEHLFGPQLDEIEELEAENYIVGIAAIRSFTQSGLEGSNP